MSLTVLLIALVPAVGVIVVANTTRNKGAVVIAAMVATAVGAATGNPAYTGLDLVFVGIATYISWQIAKTPIHRTPEEVAAAQEKARVERIKAEEAKAKRNKAVTEFFKAVVVLGAVAALLIWQHSERSAPQSYTSSTAVQPQPQQFVPAPVQETTAQQKPKKVVRTQPSEPKQRNVKNTNATEKHPVEKCLTIPDEQGMMRCLERYQ